MQKYKRSKLVQLKSTSMVVKKVIQNKTSTDKLLKDYAIKILYFTQRCQSYYLLCFQNDLSGCVIPDVFLCADNTNIFSIVLWRI